MMIMVDIFNSHDEQIPTLGFVTRERNILIQGLFLLREYSISKIILLSYIQATF